PTNSHSRDDSGGPTSCRQGVGPPLFSIRPLLDVRYLQAVRRIVLGEQYFHGVASRVALVAVARAEKVTQGQLRILPADVAQRLDHGQPHVVFRVSQYGEQPPDRGFLRQLTQGGHG